MTDPRLEDHVVGLELQLVELVERRERALVQGMAEEAEALAAEIDEVQTELIVTAETLAADKPVPHADVLAESAEDATFTLVDAGMHPGPDPDANRVDTQDRLAS
jgi:hypothetical protein